MKMKLKLVAGSVIAMSLMTSAWSVAAEAQVAPQSVETANDMGKTVSANLTPAPVMTRPAMPTQFKDISEQYTKIVGGVPVIINPTSCGKNRLELRVDVDNVEKGEGSIVADVHDNIKENFLKGDKVILRVRAKATKGRTSFCIPMREAGDYAVAFYHDKNDNMKFDKGFLGIPKEHFGMSNNPKFGLKSPDFEDAVFTMPSTGAHLEISLKSAGDIMGKKKK